MSKFPLITGQLSLDLVNTERQQSGKKSDLLLNKTDFTAWLAVETKWFPFLNGYELERDEAVFYTFLDRLKSYRSFLRQGFEEVIDGKDVLRRFQRDAEQRMAACPLTLKLVDGQIHPYPAGKDGDALFTLLAVDLLKFIASGKLGAIKRCANPDCMLLFVDKSGRRRWCSMKLCGNRMKATRRRDKC
ncbi:MAG: CGNR zinc finger domain-containing protein [Sporolactobacillus sp.]